MTVEILLSTMHECDHSIVERINLQCNAVVVNQCDTDSVEYFDYNDFHITWINSAERGLSRSRNKALEYSTADICLLVDDDEILEPEYVSTISDAFMRNTDADVIGFQAEGIESVFKVYSGKEGRVGYIRSMRMASVEIAFRRNSLHKVGLKFNEYIGAGTQYKMGEENTLLFNCLRHGLNIYYVPRLICKIHIGNSTWFSGYDDEYFHARGAVFTAMSREWSLLLIGQFALLKYKLYKRQMSFAKAFKLMLQGRKEYIHSEK